MMLERILSFKKIEQDFQHENILKRTFFLIKKY